MFWLNRLNRKLDKILDQQDHIIKHLHTMAVTLADFKAAFAEINESTTNIAADIDRLASSIASGLSDADEQAALDELKGISTQLKDIAAKTPDGEPTPTP